jgi:hypothetical protein
MPMKHLSSISEILVELDDLDPESQLLVPMASILEATRSAKAATK